MESILSLMNVKKIYRKGDTEVVALAGINIEFERQEFCAIVGPSGSGKTTLLNIIGCLDRPTEGSVTYLSKPLASLDEKAFLRIAGSISPLYFSPSILYLFSPS